MTELGINLSFALKRWPEPERWAAIVAERLGLRSIQFTLDLIDAWWPQAERSALARSARAAAEAHEIATWAARSTSIARRRRYRCGAAQSCA